MAEMLALALLAAIPQAEPVVLDELIAFSDPVDCTPTPQFAQLLAQIWADRDGDRSKLTAVPPSYRPGFGKLQRTVAAKDGFIHASLGSWGTWHGLPLTSIEIWSRSDIKPAFALVFAAPGEQVAAALLQLGFDETSVRIQPDTGGISVSSPTLVSGHDTSRRSAIALRCPLP